MDYKQQIERGIELLKLCQTLQSEKDGVDRPEPFKIDKSKTLDQFAQDIGTAVTNMTALYKLIPMMLTLAETGKKLHEDGEIDVALGEDYSTAALAYLIANYQRPIMTDNSVKVDGEISVQDLTGHNDYFTACIGKEHVVIKHGIHSATHPKIVHKHYQANINNSTGDVIASLVWLHVNDSNKIAELQKLCL